MISKRIHCKKANDNYSRLANYIADASHGGEKSLISWTASTWIEDDYNLAIQEVVDTQSLNLRTTKEKTYHLIISFKTEDEGKLKPEDYINIEKRFAKALGFEEHQRHCGVHKNTDNTHMHIAYNMIHPVKLTRHEPFRDYRVRNAICREVEKEYNLNSDKVEKSTENEHKLSNIAATLETRQGVESFERYVVKHKEPLSEALEKANSWEDIHQSFGFYGIELKPRGAGLIIQNMYSRQAIKASTLSRNFSYKNLVEKFGEYTPVQNKIIPQIKYTKDPLQNAKDSKHWDEFVKLTHKERVDDINEKYYKKEIELILKPLKRSDRSRLQKLLKLEKKQEITALKREGVKFNNWNTFLQDKAERGDEVALQLLQSKNKNIIPENTIVKPYISKKQLEQDKMLEKKQKILSNPANDAKTTKRLLALNNMDKQNIKYTFKVTRNGGVLFTFEDGSKMIDYGQKIVFSDEAAKIAMKYTKDKLGYAVEKPKNNEIFLKREIEKRNIQKQYGR